MFHPKKIYPSMLIIVCISALIGCTTTKSKLTALDMTKINLKDNKASVLRKLGPVFNPIAKDKEQGHTLEILEFPMRSPYVHERFRASTIIYYWLYFLDGKLYKYERVSQGERLGGKKEMKKFKDQALSKMVMSQLPIP